jgi:Aspartyl protease
MRKFSFQLHTLDDLILVEAYVNDFPLTLALDTAASQSVIDWNALYLAGCPVPKPSETDEVVSVETAAGIMDVPLYVVEQLNALGVTRKQFQVLTYDFLEKGLISPYDGVLGLDFFRQQGVLTIDFLEQKLWFEPKKKR